MNLKSSTTENVGREIGLRGKARCLYGSVRFIGLFSALEGALKIKLSIKTPLNIQPVL